MNENFENEDVGNYSYDAHGNLLRQKGTFGGPSVWAIAGTYFIADFIGLDKVASGLGYAAAATVEYSVRALNGMSRILGEVSDSFNRLENERIKIREKPIFSGPKYEP